jgi:hypothetical protein
MKHLILAALAIFLFIGTAQAKVDLVTLPTRDTVQMTIYNSADMTLVRESRTLTLKQGLNRLQFSWANTLIDPTSLEILPLANSDQIQVLGLDYPPRLTNLGVWTIDSRISGKVPMEITYLTSGLTWRAFYLATLTNDEKEMNLEGFVRVTNQSGEDYDDAQTRLIVGQVHLLDEIAELARRQYPYGSPLPLPVPAPAYATDAYAEEEAPRMAMAKSFMAGAAADEPKEIVKEALSEYFLYTIEGTENIAHGWSKRLPSFQAAKVPVVNLYKYEEERYGDVVMRFLSFKNDQAHTLGETPIPGGELKAYRLADASGRLAYEGQSEFKYIPVGEDVELNLGGVSNVVVKSKTMDFRSDNYLFDNNGNITGWDETREFKIEVKNTREIPIKVEIKRNFESQQWDLANQGDIGKYEKVDMNTVKYTLELPGRSQKTFSYILTTRMGRRAD